MPKPKAAWVYDRETKVSILDVASGEDAFVLVYKSAGGDYVISAQREGDPGGGEIEYRDTLYQAKKFAEGLAAGDGWKDYTMDIPE